MKLNLRYRKLAVFILALALFGGALGWSAFSDSGSASALTSLDARSLADLKTEFNAAIGRTRVIVLLSPT